MRDYLNKVKGYCDVLNAYGYKISNEDRTLYIMTRLGSKYNPVMMYISSRIDSTKGSSPTENMATQ